MNENQYPYNSIVYHYTTVEAALEILHNKTLKFSSFSSFPHLNKESFNKVEEFLDIKTNFRIACFSETLDNKKLWQSCANKNEGVIIGFRFTKEMFESRPYTLKKVNYVANPEFDYENHQRFDAIINWLTTKHFSSAEDQEINLVAFTPDRPLFLKNSPFSITFGLNTSELQKVQLYALGKQKGISTFYEIKALSKSNQWHQNPYGMDEIKKEETEILSKVEFHKLLLHKGFQAYFCNGNAIRFKKNHGSRFHITISNKEIQVGSQGSTYESKERVTLKEANEMIAFVRGIQSKKTKLASIRSIY